MVSITYFMACQLLTIGGCLKILNPQLSHDAWKKLNLPSSLLLVRSVGFLLMSRDSRGVCELSPIWHPVQIHPVLERQEESSPQQVVFLLVRSRLQ